MHPAVSSCLCIPVLLQGWGRKHARPLFRAADLIQLAAVAAIAAAGGPKIHIALGRADSWGYPPPGRLPDPASSALLVVVKLVVCSWPETWPGALVSMSL